MFRQHPLGEFFEKIENLAGNRQKLSLVRIPGNYPRESLTNHKSVYNGSQRLPQSHSDRGHHDQEATTKHQLVLRLLLNY